MGCSSTCVHCITLTSWFVHLFSYHFVLKTLKFLWSTISETHVPLSSSIVLYCATSALLSKWNLILVDNVLSFWKSLLEKLKKGVKPLGSTGKYQQVKNMEYIIEPRSKSKPAWNVALDHSIKETCFKILKIGRKSWGTWSPGLKKSLNHFLSGGKH